MAANPNPALITAEMWRLWEEVSRIIPGVKLSGIYANKKGYHNTVNANLKNWPGNYSTKFPLDLVPDNRNKARGIDLTMSTVEMIKWTKRMKASAENPADHRLAHVREFYGTLDGKTVFGMVKDSLHGPWRKTSADLTHLWHGHVGIFTLFVNKWEMLSSFLSVWKGQSFLDWSFVSMDLPQEGDNGQSVFYWQYVHNKVRHLVKPASPPITIDGDYGTKTSAAFLDFWKKCGGISAVYRGNYITGFLAMQYHMALAEVSVAKPPPTTPPIFDEAVLKAAVVEWLEKKFPEQLIVTGELKGKIQL